LFEFVIDYSNFDLTNIIEETISLYWFNPDTLTWEKVETELDMANNTATANLNHASLFALMGEVKDLAAPTTQVIIAGDKGQDNWYRSDVSVSLNAQDNENGVGVNETYYSIGNDIDWQLYNQPLTFTDEGTYAVFAHSIDKGGNVETPHSVTFNIDKTLPEARIAIDLGRFDLQVEGIDENSQGVSVARNKNFQATYTITDKAGNTLKLDVRDFDKKKLDQFKIYALTYNQDQPIIEPKNQFSVIYLGRPNPTNVFAQYLSIKDTVQIIIFYDKRNDRSIIYTREGNQLKQKEIRNGLVTLQVSTNNGNLDYSY